MKRVLTIIILIFSVQTIWACCGSGMVTVAPRSHEIAQNPIILIDFMERDYKIYDKLDELQFYLVDNKGRKVPLKILEKNKAHHTLAQVLLQPQKKLKRGRVVSLKITGMSSPNKMQKWFIKKVQSRKWTVLFKKDKIAPTFNGEVTQKYINDFNSSASSHGISIKADFSDNHEYRFEANGFSRNQIIVEATNEEGKKYLLVTYGNSFGIHDGICGATFHLKTDTQYRFQIRLMDFSGNKSSEIKEIKFKTGNIGSQ